MQKISVLLLLAAACLAAGTLSARAATIFSENFDDITIPGSSLALVDETPGPATPNSSFTSNVSPGTGGSINAMKDAANFFGNGASNQILEMIDGTGTAVLSGPAALNGTGFQISLRFYDPSDYPVGTGAEGNRVILGTANGLGGSARSVDIHLRNGTLRYHNGSSDQTVGTYAQDQPHTMRVFGNYSDSPISYGFNGLRSVDPGKYDIFIGTALLADDVPFRNPSTASAFFGLSATGPSTVTTSYFDNIVVENSLPPIPEPSAFVLIGSFALGIVMADKARTRRHSN